MGVAGDHQDGGDSAQSDRDSRGGDRTGPPPPPAAALSRSAMEQPRLITDSFPRRRRTGRAPGRAKRRGCPRPRAPPPAEDPPPPPPDQTLLEMLRRFDLAWEYGPCTGITRLQRWERAQALGLSPPGPVRDALLEHRDNPDVTYSLWHEYAI
ncbi:DNA polymerase delta subunit 4 [Gavia stellata]|uniref:DNA polymerase delta subunit 4 n=1 Tax=Gavia stellata TaxID=37040 RepID=UPI00289CDC07|nr:DNA polymerase delta subunit 4 [Gavia stellata]